MPRMGTKTSSSQTRKSSLSSCEALTQPSVRNGSSRTQLLPTGPRQIRSDCRGTFWPSSAPRIDAQGVQTSPPWTINFELFWRTRHTESVTTAWRAQRDTS